MTSEQVAARHPVGYPGAWVQAAVSASLLVVLGVLVAGSAAPGPVDASLAGPVPRTPPWPAVALGVDWLGEPLGAGLVGVVLVGVLLLARHPRYAVLVVVAQASILVAGDLVKVVVGRTIHDGHLSYPSGHTAGAVASVLVLALFVTDVAGARRSVRLVVVVLSGLGAAVLAGWAQVTLDAHYPTDVIGGILLAFAVVPVAAQVIDGVADRRRRSPVPDGPGDR